MVTKMNVFKKAIEDYLTKERFGRCDFHTHSFLSDGVLLPIEQIRRAHVIGHEVYAITDHVGAGNFDVIDKVKQDCLLAIKQWGIVALPGIELTHVPAIEIPKLAQEAREKGALIIVIHGETINEPVEPGTNLNAAKSKEVDILAHPGMLTKQEANLCKKNDIFVEITSNRSHSITNGHVVIVGREAKVKFIQNTDTHKLDDMLTYTKGKQILLGAGMTEEETEKTLQNNVRDFLTKIAKRI